MGKRFAIVIGVVAAGMIALGAQTAAAAPFDTKVSMAKDRGRLIHGDVRSKAERCEADRRWVLFKQRPGSDLKLGAGVAEPSGGDHPAWGMVVPRRANKNNWHLYVKVKRKVVRRHHLLCLGDRADHFF